VLSTDAASTVLRTFFVPTGPPRVLIYEPGTPALVLAPADASAAAQRLDSAVVPAPAGTELLVATATDSSGAVVSYGLAVDYISSEGTVHGPFALTNVGLLSITAAVALENGAGAVLLGLGQEGPVWTTLGPGGFGTLTTLSFGETPDATQPAPVLWDDGTGNLSAVLPLSYGQGTSQGLFALRGSGSPFAFGSPSRLDVQSPGEVTGFQVVLGPTGTLGVLLSEGPSGQAGSLAGFTLGSTGTLSGGVIPATLSAALTLEGPGAGSVPWFSACGNGGSCDPLVRFAGNGDLVAAWTLDGELSFARLPSGSGSWQSPQQIAGGPLLSELATDAAGDLAGLAQLPDGDAIAVAPVGGSPSFEALPQITGFAPGPLVGATAAGGGALWATESVEPGEIFDWTFSPGGGTPSAGATATLPSGEEVLSLATAASAVPSSAGSSFFGAASAGWMLIGGGLDNSADVLLATFNPTTGAVGTPTSVAVSGWQDSNGVSASKLFVDSSGTALVAFSQAVGSTATNLYLSSAKAGGTPADACDPIAPVSGGPVLSLYVDQVPYGPSVLTGSGRLVVSYDAPATVSLAE
jgi:hypothetical protein